MSHPASESPNGNEPGGEPLTGADLEAALSAGQAEVAPRGSGGHYWAGVVELRFTQFMIAAMTLLVLASAVTRAVARPMAWTVDMALLTFAWSVFIGADVALRNGRMVNIDLVITRLPSRVRAGVQLFNSVLIIVFLGAMVGLGLLLSYTTRHRSFPGMPGISYTWATLSVPVGCALMLWTMLRSMPGQVRELRAPETGPLTDQERMAGAAGGEAAAL